MHTIKEIVIRHTWMNGKFWMLDKATHSVLLSLKIECGYRSCVPCTMYLQSVTGTFISIMVNLHFFARFFGLNLKRNQSNALALHVGV